LEVAFASCCQVVDRRRLALSPVIALYPLNVNRMALGIGALVIVCAVAAAAAFMTQGSASPEVLPPAPGPPVAGLCTAQLDFGADGNAAPLFCPNGDINRLAWKYFADKRLAVMGMGIFAADTDVAAALRQDLSGHATSPVECSAYQLASAYYGWRFVVDPTSGVLAGGCRIERP
jgi:hypothetical protein